MRKSRHLGRNRDENHLMHLMLFNGFSFATPLLRVAGTASDK